MGLFNKTYQLRARRGMVQVGEVLQELVERAARRRPEQRIRPGAAARQCKKRGGKFHGQLELFPVEESADEMFQRLFPIT